MNRFCSHILAVYLLLFMGVSLNGCASRTELAPVVNAWYQSKAASNDYSVRRGDTIYSIAWAFGLDYRALARANGIRPPYHISVGQRLKMTNIPRGKKLTRVSQSNAMILKKHRMSPVLSGSVHWRWPAKGRLLQRFSLKQSGTPGLAIAGRLGEYIRAASTGRVVYSGDGVRGYGNLIIIKHNDSFLSAYAFNQRNLVKVGRYVRGGSVIARMGQNNAGRTLLYFEIRRNGMPVNPLQYLQ